MEPSLDAEAQAYADLMTAGSRKLESLVLTAIAGAVAATVVAGVAFTRNPIVLVGVFVVTFLLAGRTAAAVRNRDGSLDGLAMIPDDPEAAELTATPTERGRATTVTLTVSPAAGQEMQPHFIGVRCFDETTRPSSEQPIRGRIRDSWVTVHPNNGAASVAITVPADDPYSYHGSWVRLRWEVVAATVAGREHTIYAKTPLEVGVGDGAAGDGVNPSNNTIENGHDRQITAEPTRVAMGQPITVRVEFTEDVPRARALDLKLMLCERIYHNPSEVNVVDQVRIHEGPITRGQVFTWECTVPAGSYPSMVDGPSGLQWQVESRVDGRGIDTVRSVDIWVDGVGASGDPTPV